MFKEWLIKKKKLQVRSARDVESRTRRLKRMSERFHILEEEYLSKLIEKETDSTFVRSQLKRAAKLYSEFLAKNDKQQVTTLNS